ncbi:MAG: hypothetical protein ACK5XA_01420 [Tagaea sp.]|jgi:hypothetical protein|nr:hypothetical protein [Magnetospirillum sp.]
MRALKTIVIFLGVLCVGAFAFLVYVVAGGVGKAPAPDAAAPRPPIAGLAWNDVAIPAPAGSTLAGAFAAGEHVVVHVNPPDAAPFLVVVDPKAGRVIGRILLGARP